MVVEIELTSSTVVGSLVCLACGAYRERLLQTLDADVLTLAFTLRFTDGADGAPVGAGVVVSIFADIFLC